MRSLFLCFLGMFCISNAIEYSHRIKAFGPEFAYLIPDYETDLYRNPQLLGERLGGVSITRYGPIKLIFLSSGFGVHYSFQPSYAYYDYFHTSWHTMYSYDFEDLWMLRVKNEVWNLYNDGFIEKSEHHVSGDYSLESNIDYFAKAQTSFNIGRHLNLDIKLGGGFYKRLLRENNRDSIDQFVGIPSVRLNLLYRNVTSQNNFTSWIIEFGGPISTAEINELPYSIFVHLYPLDRASIFFANTLIAKIAWVKGLPLNNNSFVTLGWRNNFLYQQIKQVDPQVVLSGIDNSLYLPIGVEYVIGKFSLRFGVKLCHHLSYRKDNIDKVEHKHAIGTDRTFGFGWRITDNFTLDFYSYENVLDVQYGSVYLKYLF